MIYERFADDDPPRDEVEDPGAEIHFHAGMIELALKQPEAARICFHRALSLNPNFHPVRAKLAAEMMATQPTSRPAP